MDLKSRGIINGYPDGTFKPDQFVNRAEALKLILGAVKVEIPTDAAMGLAGFSDVDGGQWYAPYLRKALSMGVVEGYPDGTFRPAQTVNLVENLKILIKAENIDLSGVTDLYINPYHDVEYWGWYTPYLAYAGKKNLIVADAKGNIYPDQGMTRGKLAEVLYKFMYIQDRNIDHFPKGQMILDDTNEPIVFSTNNLNVSVFKNATPVKEFFGPDQSSVAPYAALEDAAISCGTELGASGYFDNLMSTMNGDVTTYTFVQNITGQKNLYMVNIMPNSTHYLDLQAFKTDFNVCTPGGVYPVVVTDQWLLSAESCAETKVAVDMPFGCTDIMAAIGNEVKLK